MNDLSHLHSTYLNCVDLSRKGESLWKNEQPHFWAAWAIQRAPSYSSDWHIWPAWEERKRKGHIFLACDTTTCHLSPPGQDPELLSNTIWKGVREPLLTAKCDLFKVSQLVLDEGIQYDWQLHLMIFLRTLKWKSQPAIMLQSGYGTREKQVYNLFSLCLQIVLHTPIWP